MNMRFSLLLLLVLTLGIGCTAHKVALHEPVLFASIENFKLGPKGGVDLVWSTKRISDAETLKEALQKYDSLMLDQSWLVVDKESASQIDDKQVLATSRQMIDEIKARLGHDFKLVESPTETTLLLSVAMTDIEASVPVLAVTSHLLSDNSDSATVSRIVMGEQIKSGGVTVELLVSDSRTREPLVAVIDKRMESQGLGTLIGSSAVAKEDISLWADRLWTTLSYWNWIKKRTPNS